MKQPQPNVYTDKETGYWLFDTLLERWEAKKFPYDQPRALIPQTIIPNHIRNGNDKEAIYFFYMIICIWMRGGIESLQAFKAVIKMRLEHPELFDPYEVQYWKPEDLQPIVKRYIGWDSKNASRFWIENAKRVMRQWDGKPSEMFKDLYDFDEAVRRIKNKSTLSKKKKTEADAIYGNGLGFMGYKEKMVAMLLYFIDWEGLLPKRFPYPTPADFHNFRLGLAHRIIVLDPQPVNLRNHELISAPWRDLTLQYLKDRKADPVKLADAIWLFSLEACGNSPLTDWHERVDKRGHGMFSAKELPHSKAPDFRAPGVRQRLLRTCLACPLLDTCELAIPAGPYYQRRGDRDEAFGGQLYLLPRFPIERHITPVPLDYLPVKLAAEEKPLAEIFEDLEEQLAPVRPTKLPL